MAAKPDPYNQPDPLDSDPFDPVNLNAARIRLDPLSWPEGTDVDVHHKAHDVWEVARDLLEQFVAHDAKNRADQNLSPQGVTAANVNFANKCLPGLQKELDRLTDDHLQNHQKALDHHISKFMGKRASAPSDPNHIAVNAEICAWLRSLPEAQRTLKVRELAMGGDKTVIQAVLHAPGYLTGVDQDVVRTLQMDLWKKADPQKHHIWKNAGDVSRMTRRALDGVIKYIGGQTGTLKQLRKPADKAA